MSKIIITEVQFKKLMGEQSGDPQVDKCLKVFKNHPDYVVKKRSDDIVRNEKCESDDGIKDILEILEANGGLAAYDQVTKFIPGHGCVVMVKSKLFGLDADGNPTMGPNWVLSIFASGSLVLTKWNEDFTDKTLDPAAKGGFKLLWNGKWTPEEFRLNWYGKWKNGTPTKMAPLDFWEKVMWDDDGDPNTPEVEKIQQIKNVPGGTILDSENYLKLPNYRLVSPTKSTNTPPSDFNMLLDLVRG